jgi:hypothetical protein
VTIICHGRSSSTAIKNAIRVAKEFAENKVNEKLEAEWTDRVVRARRESPAFGPSWDSFWNRDLAVGWESRLPSWTTNDKPVATRKASEKVMNALAPVLPQLIGGSADLAESNLTYLEGQGDFQKDNRLGRNLRFGIREHAMGAVVSGIALSGPFIAFTTSPGIIPSTRFLNRVFEKRHTSPCTASRCVTAGSPRLRQAPIGYPQWAGSRVPSPEETLGSLSKGGGTAAPMTRMASKRPDSQ